MIKKNIWAIPLEKKENHIKKKKQIKRNGDAKTDKRFHQNLRNLFFSLRKDFRQQTHPLNKVKNHLIWDRNRSFRDPFIHDQIIFDQYIIVNMNSILKKKKLRKKKRVGLAQYKKK